MRESQEAEHLQRRRRSWKPECKSKLAMVTIIEPHTNKAPARRERLRCNQKRAFCSRMDIGISCHLHGRRAKP